MGGIEKDCRGSVQCVLRMYTCSVGVYSVKVWFLYTHIHTLYTHPAHEHCGYTPLHTYIPLPLVEMAVHDQLLKLIMLASEREVSN